METLMSTFTKTFALGLFVLLNACGASAVTASSRIEGGAGFGAGLGPIVEAKTPPNVEQPMFDRQVADRNTASPRDNVVFRMDKDCWRCR